MNLFGELAARFSPQVMGYLQEAGRLAAYYSSMRGSDKVEIDYVQKKHVKKPNGAKPGFVVYYTNYSLVIDSDISGITSCLSS